MNFKKDKITLIAPLFSKEVDFHLKPTLKMRLLAPIYNILRLRLGIGAVDLLLIVTTLGVYWLYLPKILCKREISIALQSGYKLKFEKDLEIIRREKILPSEYIPRISIARLGSADDMFPQKLD